MPRVRFFFMGDRTNGIDEERRDSEFRGLKESRDDRDDRENREFRDEYH